MHFYWLNLLGVVVFAISGVLVAAKANMDIVGALVLGMITAVGGGTIRDIILNHGPVFWLVDCTDLVLAFITAFLTAISLKHTPRHFLRVTFNILDAIGLAVFVSIGVNKVLSYEINIVVAITMGVLTGIGGGVFRDVLAREVPMVFRTDIYASACLLGALTHVLTYQYLGSSLELASWCGMFVTLTIRLAAIKWHLKLPPFKK